RHARPIGELRSPAVRRSSPTSGNDDQRPPDRAGGCSHSVTEPYRGCRQRQGKKRASHFLHWRIGPSSVSCQVQPMASQLLNYAATLSAIARMPSAVAALLLVLSLLMSQAQATDFAEQQVWSYRTRKGEEGSTLLINKVENDPNLGQIFHISVAKVRVRNRHAPSGVIDELPHFPVSKQTLEASCTKLVGKSAPNPEYVEGYNEWKRAFDQGKAGVFTISVAEIVQIVEDTLNR